MHIFIRNLRILKFCHHEMDSLNSEFQPALMPAFGLGDGIWDPSDFPLLNCGFCRELQNSRENLHPETANIPEKICLQS